MDKETLLEQLVLCVKTEEEIVSEAMYFLEHVETDSIGMPPDSVRRWQELLYVLEIDSRRHKNIVMELIGDIQKEKKNEY